MRFTPFLALLALAAAPAAAEIWRSPLLDETYVHVAKRIPSNVVDPEQVAGSPSASEADPLPSDVAALLGPNAEDYDAFSVTFLPPAAAGQLSSALVAHGLSYTTTQDRMIHLPWHHFEPGDEKGRLDRTLADQLSAVPVPNLFLVQFAYPIRAEWLDQLDDCGAERVGYFQHRTYLVRAPHPEALVSCGVSRYLAWIDSYLTSDRVSPDHLDPLAPPSEYWLQFLPGTDLSTKPLELGAQIEEVLDSYVSPDGRFTFLRVRAAPTGLLPVVDLDPDLMVVAPAGVEVLSDERQGQIVAGNHTGVVLTGPGYKSWLSFRSLLTSTNQQTVAVIDTGYDDGQHPGVHHPDLENPDRLLGLDVFAVGPADAIGHGTMVAGIIAADGATGTMAQDLQGYFYGTGISPKSKIYAVRLFERSNLSAQQFALDNASAKGAFIVNQSWNQRSELVTSHYAPLNTYDPVAQFIDDRVLDMSSASGFQPGAIVFSAGNFRQNCNGLSFDTVASPATAKNVISVGATRSYRPSPEPPLDCRPCTEGDGTQGSTNFGRAPNEDANNVGRVANFSSRGRFFSKSPDAQNRYAHLTRIKPDLVAPGVRVFSTVPYNTSTYPESVGNTVGCADFYPNPNASDHTYGSGTSFAAPVVSGVAALMRKWFLDRGTSPSPSLLKAAMIATADTLAGPNQQDHRPSATYGWGRVNLNRLTDFVAKFYRSDSASLALHTGQSRSWTRVIDDGAIPTFIVLVWSDPPSSPIASSQVGLVNDLQLKVDGGKYLGNFFNEYVTGVDDGYSYEWLFGAGGNDPINNVEAVFIPPNEYPSGSSITLSVLGRNVTTTAAQPFAIYAYNVRP